MERINQKELDAAFLTRPVRNITIIRLSEQQWYFTFEADDPDTSEPQIYTLETQRGQLRVWSDPRTLISFLHNRYNISTGTFYIMSGDDEQ